MARMTPVRIQAGPQPCFPPSPWLQSRSPSSRPLPENCGQGTFCPRTNCPRAYIVPGQNVPGTKCPPIWHYFAVQEGDILSQETYCPSTGRGHIVPGDILSRYRIQEFLATFGNFWQHLVTFGNKWQHLVTFGNKRQLLGGFGVVIGGFRCFLVVFHGFDNFWQLLTTFGNKWYFMVTCCNFW